MALPPSARTNDEAHERVQKIKIVVAAAVIVLCAVWLAYVMFSGRPVTEVKPTRAADKFVMATGRFFEDEKNEFISLVPSEDGASVRVVGKVATAGELEALKAGFGEVAAELSRAGDTLEVVWEVEVRR